MTGEWGSKELNIEAQPITASGCWKMPDKPDGWKELAWAGVSSGFGTENTFSWNPSDGSGNICFASEDSNFHGSMITKADIEESGSGKMTSTFTSCKNYKPCASADACSSLLSTTPEADEADGQCKDKSEHEMEYSWELVPDSDSPLKFRIDHVQCTFDGAKCSDLLPSLQSSGDPKEKAQKVFAALTVAAQKAETVLLTKPVKEKASSSSGR